MPFSSLYAYFVHVFRCSKQVIQTKIYPKKGIKIELFLQKTQKLFCVSFLRPPSKVTNFYTSPMPPHFENFSLNTLNSEQKPSAKTRLTGPVKNRSTGDDFEIYRSDRENPDRFHLWFVAPSSRGCATAYTVGA